MKAEIAKRRFTSKSMGAEAVEVIGAAIQDLSKQNACSPQTLVDAARNKKSPLHKYFEWNDSKAAEKYRRTQARFYMSVINVEYTTKETGTVSFRAFQPTYTGGLGKQWKPTLEIASTKQGMDELLEKARAELKTFREKYTALRTYAKAHGMLRAIDEFVAEDGDGDSTRPARRGIARLG